MPTFIHSIEIDASPERVWAVLGDLGSVDRWIPGVVSVAVAGHQRVCTFEDGHTQTEQILDYSTTDRSFRYRIDGAPLPVTDNVGSFAVLSTEQASLVTWESSFEPVDPAAADQLSGMWEPFLPMVLANLKSVVEGQG